MRIALSMLLGVCGFGFHAVRDHVRVPEPQVVVAPACVVPTPAPCRVIERDCVREEFRPRHEFERRVEIRRFDHGGRRR